MNVEVWSQQEQLQSVSGLTSQAGDNTVNLQILAKLKSLCSRMTAMEQRMSDTRRSRSTRGHSRAIHQVLLQPITVLNN